MSGDNPFVVVGSGIAGLTAALLLRRRFPSDPIVIIEREHAIGGLWRSFEYDVHGYFDHGMHNLFETNIPELDEMLFSILAPADWIVLEGRNRDLAGVFHNKKLQTYSPSIDLRYLPEKLLCRIIGEVFESAIKFGDCVSTDISAETFADQQWGKTVSERFIAPIMHRQFGVQLADLDSSALALTALTRVILIDEMPMRDFIKSNRIRSRIAFPEQRNLPSKYASGRRGFYPRKRGMQQAINALEQKLIATGVDIFVNAQICDQRILDGQVESITIKNADMTKQIDNIRNVIWSGGLIGASKFLNLKMADLSFDRPRDVRVVNFVVDDHAACDGLHYLYCYDNGFRSFRVTLYRNFGAIESPPAGYSISVELLDVEERDAIPVALRELNLMGILNDKTTIHFAKSERLASGFPMPSVLNSRSFTTLRHDISCLGLNNFGLVGAHSKPGLFFQVDVLSDVWHHINAL